jgi:hypothetical protein
LALVIVAGVGVWQFVLRDTTTEVPVDAVVDEFRTSSTTAATVTVAAHLPEVGVYVYSTVGDEGVDALGGARHRYPGETTITVSRGSCGVVLQWLALEERSEQWDLCVDADGHLYGTYYEARHEFFGQDDRRRYTCPDSITVLPEVPAGAGWRTTCTSDGLTEITESTNLGTERLDIGGTGVEAVRLQVSTTLSGDDGTHGTSSTEVWLDPVTALPLRRVERNSTTSSQVIGDVHYDERYELTLTSLQPRR